MSERTISPGMEHIKSVLPSNNMNNGLTSPTTGASGSAKRKWSPDHSDSSTATLTSQHETLPGLDAASPHDANPPRESKRTKVDEEFHGQSSSADALRAIPSDRSQLPGEMWQYIFTCLPPYSLGRLMCVNKIFHTLLAPDGVLPAPQLAAHGALSLTDQDHLWSLSRRAFFRGMPRPLFSRSEYATWKLIRGNGCEFCGKTNHSTLPPVSTSPWAAGPGNDYVRVIWAFAVRSCGNCLRARLQKETDLLFSSSSALLPALPFTFFTPSLNYVASIILRSEPPPTGLQLTKWYFGPQVDEMKAKLDDVRKLGAPTAEEWFKGLEEDGRAKAAETARWEQWELAGGFQAIAYSISQIGHFQRPSRDMNHHFSAASEKQGSSCIGTATINDLSIGRLTTNVQAHPWTIQAPSSTLPPKPATPISPYGLPYPGTLQGFSLPVPKPHTRVERSIHDVNEKKNARRAEIERRCAELNPPIKSSTLTLMDSFAAALQIAMPLTDQAWELLKPRLLAQRDAAEQQEREQLVQNQFLIQQTEERKQQEAQLREAKENLDRVWEESQTSVREKLETYADNFVREQWQNGDGVTKASCAQFAADMLLHVRHRFYISQAIDDARMRAMGIPVPVDSPNTAPTRKLTLENMRWVYENKIRPLTEHFQKELFLCNACDNHGKYYSLDSVVQHFAAKHTDSLSMGTAVVYWKADWPELPPFDPNPTAAKASLYASAIPSPALPAGQFMYHAPPTYQGNPAGTLISPDQPMYPSSHNGQNVYQRPSQGYGNASPAYQEPPSPRNAFHRNDQTASRSFSQQLTTSYPGVQGYGFPPPSDHHDWRRKQLGPNSAVNLYQQHFPASLPSQQPEFGARPGSALSYVSQNPPYSSMPHPPHQFSRPQPQAGVRSVFSHIPPGQPMGIYQVQIQELAQNAREIWNGTSDISDMPDSVRVQVIIRHVVLRFKDKYTNEPNLALFTDGLNNNSQMSPLRALSGLSCKACATESRMDETYGNQKIHDLEHRIHTLPALLAHFQSAHVEHVQPTAISPSGIEMPRLDWKFDMVEMPDATVVRNLVYSPGITQAKLDLIATVLPSYFHSPLPQVDPTLYHNNDDEIATGSRSRKTPHDRDTHLRGGSAAEAPFGGLNSAIGHLHHLPVAGENDGSQRSVYRMVDRPVETVSKAEETAREDEYDPHRPAFKDDRDKTVVSDPHGHDAWRGHDEVSAHDVVRDIRGLRKVRGVNEENRPAATSDYTFPPSTQPLSGRSSIQAHNLSIRNTCQMEPHTRWAGQEIRPVQAERRLTPSREPLNAAEQFLQSFDLTSDIVQEPLPPTPAVGTSQGDAYSCATGEEQGFRTRIEDLNWLSNHQSARNVESSRNSSPSDIVPAQGRYEMVDGSPAEPHQEREYDRLYGGHLADSQPRTQRSLAASPDHQALSRVRTGRLAAHLKTVRDSPSRRPSSRFERYEAQRQGSQRPQSRSPALASEPLPADDAFRHDHYPALRPAGRQIYAASPEERHRTYPYADEIMYTRASQSSQPIRYIGKPRYLEPVQDRYVEYVRVAPRDTQPSGEYYIQRPAAHDGTDEYIGYEPTRPHEPVLEQEGHLYTRAPPSSGEYHDPYTRQMTYQ